MPGPRTRGGMIRRVREAKAGVAAIQEAAAHKVRVAGTSRAGQVHFEFKFGCVGPEP